MSAAAGLRARISDWFVQRGALDSMSELGRHKLVPRHRHSVWYYLGGTTLFLFVIQVVTGILLTLYYRPSPDEAFESVRFITGEVSFGWLIRAIHGWTANLLILVAMVHLASVFFLCAYRKPRELTWISGVLLLFIFLGFGFSGYLLPWNELSYFATRVGTEIPAALPGFGEHIVHLLRGGDDVTGATLSRFYGMHVALLPAIATVFLGFHLFMVHKHGMSVPISVEKEHGGKPVPTMPFLPNFLLRDLIGWLAVLAILAGLAALLPEGDGFFVKLELGHKADPYGATPAGLKPEWYFLAMFYALKLLPGDIAGIEGEKLGVLLFSIAGVLFFLVPFLDRKAATGRRSRLLVVVGVLAIIWLVVFTLLGRIMD